MYFHVIGVQKACLEGNKIKKNNSLEIKAEKWCTIKEQLLKILIGFFLIF